MQRIKIFFRIIVNFSVEKILADQNRPLSLKTEKSENGLSKEEIIFQVLTHKHNFNPLAITGLLMCDTFRLDNWFRTYQNPAGFSIGF